MYVLLGLGFGGGAVWTLAFFARDGYLPMIFGFESMAGPFDDLPAATFMALGILLIAVSTIDVAAGVLLWRGRRVGARMGLATDPIALALAAGFALPFLLIGVPIRAAFALVSWNRLR